MSSRPEQLARRYVGWVRRHSVVIVLAHLLLMAGALYLIKYHLPLRADFSYLLPQDAPAVQDLRKLEARVKANDAVLVLVEAPDRATQAAVTKGMIEGAKGISKELVDRVEHDDSDVRAFFKARRHLFVPLEDLQRASKALDNYLAQAKNKANPLIIDLDEPDPAAVARDKKQLEDLQAKRREAESQLDKPTNDSADGKIALIQVRTLFRSTDAGKGQALLDALTDIRTSVLAKYPGTRVGFAGGVVTAVAEHDAIFRGMVMSSLITMLLVGLVLALYFRSATLLGLLIGTLEGLMECSCTDHQWKKVDFVPSFSISEILETPDGVVWLSTPSKGVGYIYEGSFFAFTAADGLASDICHGLAQDEGGAIYVATNRGISRIQVEDYASKRLKIRSFGKNFGLASDEVRSVAVGGGKIYAATAQGLTVLDAGFLMASPPAVPVHITEFSALGRSMPWQASSLSVPTRQGGRRIQLDPHKLTPIGISVLAGGRLSSAHSSWDRRHSRDHGGNLHRF